MTCKLSKYEMETIVTFNRDEANARIYTSDPVMLRKLDKLCAQTPVITVVREDEVSRTYTCPKKLVSIRKPRLFKGFEGKETQAEESKEEPTDEN